MRLEGKVVIVTGGGLGIGRVYVRRLVAEGARVVVADIDEASARATAAEYAGPSGQTLAVTVDVADAASVARMVRTTLDAWGQIDVLVNNAALFSVLAHKPIEEISVEEWDRVMAVNVRGVFLCCQAVIPHMRQRGQGKIINVASGVVLSAPSKFTHYVASKGAVFAFTRALATEVGKAGITVNSLAPGLVATPAVRQQVPDWVLTAQHDLRALPRDETPEDLEGPLVFLASDDSDFITGQTILVDGGGSVH